MQDFKKLDGLKVLCKVIECVDSDKVKKIVQYNNTQNHITTWDHYSNSAEQKLVEEEFKTFGYVYSLKRGFENTGSYFGIESVAQPLIALHGDYASANRGKTMFLIPKQRMTTLSMNPRLSISYWHIQYQKQ